MTDKKRPTLRTAVDVGGTFIDFVLLDEETGSIRIEKISSISDSLPDQFIKGLQAFNVDFGSIDRIFHGMTVGVNALIQERGARVGLLTTKGFRDVLEMGRGGRQPVYDFVQAATPPIVARYLRSEIRERANFKGEILHPIDLEDVDREADYLISKGVDAIAVAFLHAYANPSHEIACRQRILARHPHVMVSLSHEIAAEWREYERTSTTVLNAFILPTVKTYLDQVQAKLKEAGYVKPLAIMQSNGGVADADIAAAKPIRTLMSGPAGGVIGAKFLCEKLGYSNVICTDVGGTTYDIAVIEDGKILERGQTRIAGRPILGSLIDVVSIGAGGGSIAWLDHRNALQVGPQSAGAFPGPVCFGRGGAEPTTTDAHLVLGRLDPDYFLGGRMKLDAEAAREAIRTKIADPLGISLEEAAQGIVLITETNMANAIRNKSVERGLDLRDFVTLAYGGGGGLFACAVADELDVTRVIIPSAPANFSAWGILTSDYVEDESRTKVVPFDQDHIGTILTDFDELSDRVLRAIGSYGFDSTDIVQQRRIDLRYQNQEFTITVELKPEWLDGEAVLRGARERFVAEHNRLYGHGDANGPIEQVSVRCRAIGRVRPPEISRKPCPTEVEPARSRSVYFQQAGGFVPTAIMARNSLAPGEEVAGPAIIDEWTTTTLVPPGWNCLCDEYGNLILDPLKR